MGQDFSHPGLGPKRWSRRQWIGGAGLTGLAGAGFYLYQQRPSFWRQYARDLRRPILPPPAIPHPERWPDRGLYAAWLGHTTVLLKIDGFTILTDPIFSDRAGIDLGLFTLGPKRLVAPALDIRRLPPVDLLLLSHAHMDHMDVPSLRKLENRATAVVLARHNSDLIRPERYRSVRELGWGETARAGPLSLRGVEVKHWGSRYRRDTWRGYGGYVLEAGRYRVLFGGDTAITPAFRALRSSRPFHLAILPIGAYDPWIRNHCNPEQAWQIGNEAGAEFLLPVHHQTFALGYEPVMEPIQRLQEAAGAQAARIAARRVGEEFGITG